MAFQVSDEFFCFDLFPGPRKTRGLRQMESGRKVIKIPQLVNVTLSFTVKAFKDSYFNQNMSLVFFSNKCALFSNQMQFRKSSL